MLPIVGTLSYIVRHPMNRGAAWSALVRYVRWQVGSRLVPGPVAVPFVESTRLLVRPGMTGATGNVYCGLHEYEDMALVLHALRPGDLFVDVGANIGSYSILAAGAAGANCISIEPHPATFQRLIENVRLNVLEGKVEAVNVALGDAEGSQPFTASLDTVNHVIAPGEGRVGMIEVPVVRLDSLLIGARPQVIKIDVEGYETCVIEGGAAAFASPELQCVVMELNGSGTRYGFDEDSLHQRMLGFGLTPCSYDPRSRALVESKRDERQTGNQVYVRDLDWLRKRLSSAPRFRVGKVFV